MDYAKVMSL